MDSRQRLHAALNFLSLDRTPLDIGSTDVTGIHINPYQRLCERLGINEPLELVDPLQGLARVSDEFRCRLGIDCAGIWLQPTLSPLGDGLVRDEWGTRWRRPEHGLWYEPAGYPLQNAGLPDLAAYPWPDPDDAQKLGGVAEAAINSYAHNSCGLVANFSGALLARAQLLRGPAEFLSDLLAEPEFAGELLDRILEYNLALVQNMLRAVGPRIEAIKVSDDLGSQNNTLISPALYRRMIKPRQARFYEKIHSLTQAKIIYHSCGAVSRLVDDFIEIGVDALNPIQVTATGMDSASLGEKYRGRLVFWGAVDNQGTLSQNVPALVAEEVRRRIQDLASPKGGYVMASSHNLPPNLSAETVLAFCQANRTLE